MIIYDYYLASRVLILFWELNAGCFLERGCLLGIDCSQPSIFLYFYSIVEHSDRIARELDTSAKRKT